MKSEGVAYGDESDQAERWGYRRYGWICGHCGHQDEDQRDHGSLFRYGSVRPCRACGASLLDARWSRLT